MSVLLELFQTANSSTDNLFSLLCLFSLYSIIFLNIILNRRETQNAFISAGIITMIAAIFFLAAGLIVSKTFFWCVAACAVPMVISLFLGKER